MEKIRTLEFILVKSSATLNPALAELTQSSTGKEGFPEHSFRTSSVFRETRNSPASPGKRPQTVSLFPRSHFRSKVTKADGFQRFIAMSSQGFTVSADADGRPPGELQVARRRNKSGGKTLAGEFVRTETF